MHNCLRCGHHAAHERHVNRGGPVRGQPKLIRKGSDDLSDVWRQKNEECGLGRLTATPVSGIVPPPSIPARGAVLSLRGLPVRQWWAWQPRPKSTRRRFVREHDGGEYPVRSDHAALGRRRGSSPHRSLARRRGPRRSRVGRAGDPGRGQEATRSMGARPSGSSSTRRWRPIWRARRATAPRWRRRRRTSIRRTCRSSPPSPIRRRSGAPRPGRRWRRSIRTASPGRPHRCTRWWRAVATAARRRRRSADPCMAPRSPCGPTRPLSRGRSSAAAPAVTAAASADLGMGVRRVVFRVRGRQ